MMSVKHQRLREQLTWVTPRDRGALYRWVQIMLDVVVPAAARLPGGASPLDYLAHTFFEQPGDVILWANRGGGKTFYGAVATLLDLVFKPGIHICILGGSFEQSARMYEHLRGFVDRPGLRWMLDGQPTRQCIRLINGSQVTLLAQSQTSVRGQRVQKLRCDEVELFDERVWRAAQFVTRAARCGKWHVPGRIEMFSTMHQPFGLMSRLVDRTDVRLFRWSAVDVLARCEAARDCGACELWAACEGRAKRGVGFVGLDDVLAQMRRSSRAAFETEMLCQRPSTADAVYAAFDPAVHVRAVQADHALMWVGGIDFGMRCPFVMLWAQVRPTPDGPVIEVMDEYHVKERTVEQHLAAMVERRWPRVAWVGVDPAGAARNEQTGMATVAMLRRAGWVVRYRRSRVDEGVERVRQMLEPAAGLPRLVIHPRCERLIEALGTYHFDPRRPNHREPIKDGPDHAADALRYMVVNMGGAEGAKDY